MKDNATLPPGQKAVPVFERFGLPNFAFYRGPENVEEWSVLVRDETGLEARISLASSGLERVEQVSDFHCVTTWSVRGLRWGGYRFSDVYDTLIKPVLRTATPPAILIFRGDDNYVTSLPFDDAMDENVLLADRLNGRPLDFSHGVPLRLVAPAHYGYKNVKHLRIIELADHEGRYQFAKPWPRLMEHPRARVANEERGRHFSGWFYRLLYRPLVWPIVRLFRLKTSVER